jgi:predicted lactoylglutathione lyase
MDWRLELIQVPVSDVDVAKEFHERAGFVFFSDPDGNRWSVQQIPPRGEGS